MIITLITLRTNTGVALYYLETGEDYSIILIWLRLHSQKSDKFSITHRILVHPSGQYLFLQTWKGLDFINMQCKHVQCHHPCGTAPLSTLFPSIRAAFVLLFFCPSSFDMEYCLGYEPLLWCDVNKSCKLTLKWFSSSFFFFFAELGKVNLKVWAMLFHTLEIISKAWFPCANLEWKRGKVMYNLNITAWWC